MSKKVFQNSLRYFTLKVYTWLFFRVYYRSIRIVGNYKNVKGHIIYAINHQNTAMDGLALHFARPGIMVFLARADIFKNKTAARLLSIMKILPIYRIRDGFDSLQQNSEIFDQVIETVINHVPVAILPEGSHEGKHILRPFKKGFARIAFAIAQNEKISDNVAIVPVGVDYSDYYHFRSKLSITFGNPVFVNDFIHIYEHNQAKGINELTRQVYKNLTEIIVCFGNDENYEFYQDLYQHFILTPYDDISKGVAFSAQMQKYNDITDIQRIKDLLDQYKQVAVHYGLIPNVQYSLQKSLILLIGLPFFLLSGLMIMPFHFLRKKIMKNVKDRQFRSAFTFVLGIIYFTVFYLLVFLGCLLMIGFINAIIVIGGLMCIIIAGQQFRRLISNAISSLKLLWLKVISPDKINVYLKTGQDIQNWVNGFIFNNE